MSQLFHLKLITQRAAGGDPIIRERQLPGPELTIGRATDADILLYVFLEFGASVGQPLNPALANINAHLERTKARASAAA